MNAYHRVSVRNVEQGHFLLDHLSIIAHLSVDKLPLEKKECSYRKVNKIDLDDMSHRLEEEFENFENWQSGSNGKWIWKDIKLRVGWTSTNEGKRPLTEGPPTPGSQRT